MQLEKMQLAIASVVASGTFYQGLYSENADVIWRTVQYVIIACGGKSSQVLCLK